jgi:hypothetical protein
MLSRLALRLAWPQERGMDAGHSIEIKDPRRVSRRSSSRIAVEAGEGREGFEPSNDETAVNGFRDHAGAAQPCRVDALRNSLCNSRACEPGTAPQFSRPGPLLSGSGIATSSRSGSRSGRERRVPRGGRCSAFRVLRRSRR